MPDARLIKHALFLRPLLHAEVMFSKFPLAVADVFVFLLADDVVQRLLLRVHFAVVERFGERFVAA